MVAYPGSINSPTSYVDVTLTTDKLTSTTYPAWCSDVSRDIYLNTNYAALLLSSFDPDLESKLSSLGIQLQLRNLTRANYLLSQYANQQYSSTQNNPSGVSVTYGDVQTAIWNLLQVPGSKDTDPTAPYTQRNVDFLVRDAMLRGECYRPIQGQDVYVAFIVPVGAWPYTRSPGTGMQISNQLLLLQMTVEELTPCVATYPNGSAVACLPLAISNCMSSSSSSTASAFPMSSSSTGSSAAPPQPRTNGSGDHCHPWLNPHTAELTVTKYPGNDLAKSYIDITLSHTAPEICPLDKTCEFSAWCSDTSRVIYLNTNYAAELVSSYDSNLTAIFQSYGVQINAANISVANYMLNQWWRHAYSVDWGDIQTALWRLLQIPGSIDSDSTAPFNESRVNYLIKDAMNNGRCYHPTHNNDLLTIFIIPVGIWETFQPKITNQLLLLQVTLGQFSNTSRLCWPKCQSVITAGSNTSNSSHSSSSSTGTSKLPQPPVKCHNCSCVCCSNSTVAISPDSSSAQSAAASSSSTFNSTLADSGISQDEWVGAFIGMIMGCVLTLLVQFGLWQLKQKRANNGAQTQHTHAHNPHRHVARSRV